MTKILIPVELTFSRLNAAAASRINTLHGLIGQPLVAEGDLNPYRELISDMAYGINGFDRQAPIAQSNELDHPEFITIDQMALIVALGGDVVGLPVFFEIADKTAACPFSATTPKESWENWGGGHLMGPYAGVWYRESAVGVGGVLMNASVWLPVTRHTTLTVSEIKTIQSENAPSVP